MARTRPGSESVKTMIPRFRNDSPGGIEVSIPQALDSRGSKPRFSWGHLQIESFASIAEALDGQRVIPVSVTQHVHYGCNIHNRNVAWQRAETVIRLPWRAVRPHSPLQIKGASKTHFHLIWFLNPPTLSRGASHIQVPLRI